MDTLSTKRGRDKEDLKLYFRLVNKLRLNQSECSEYFAKEKKTFDNLREQLVRMISEAKELHTRTNYLRSDFRETEEKYIALRRMLKNDFGFEVKERLQELEETTYLNRLICHLKDVDKGLAYRAIHTEDAHECSGM